MNDTILNITGNLTSDPELRFTQNGLAVANFTIASTPRVFDKQTKEYKDGEALFMRCSIWREQAEQVAQSLSKGMRVIAQGQLKQRSYETTAGEKRTVVELDVHDIGPSLKYATAQVTRTQGKGGSSQARTATNAPAPAPAYPQPATDGVGDVWGAPASFDLNSDQPF